MKLQKIDKVATGDNIKAEMDRQHITIRDMESYLGISYQAIWKYCHGQALPTKDNFYKIAQILGVAIDDLIVGK